ncbi:MAG: sulfatase-like hydrolase/transferase, partial [Planctomycetes bacterium]|nr:sulfatase-like hydrolase/transferase [Planctomycetota bacterium]
MCGRGSFPLLYLTTCGIAAVWTTTLGCKKADEQSCGVVRLVDSYSAELLANPTTPSTGQIDQTVWRFDAAAHTGKDTGKAEPTWTIGQDVADLAVSGGVMVGRTTGSLPLIHTKLDVRDRPRDVVHAVEVRMRSSVAGNLGIMFITDDEINLDKVVSRIRTFPEFSLMQSPVVAGDDMSTYTLRADLPIDSQSLRHIAVVPIDQPNAEFAIESLRVVFRGEHLAAIPSGISWQGLSGVFCETLITRAAEAVDYAVHMPTRPWLDVALGTLGNEPVTFFVDVNGDRVVQRTVTRANHWEPLRVDLAPYAGRQVKLRLSAKAMQPDILVLWGAPAIRSATSAGSTSAAPAERPQGVILIWADTLRRDHLDLYGYERETGPNIRKLAEQGANFTDCVLQATWTKVSTPSLMTGMYARSHRVWEISHKLPAVATTMAEVFRDAGYATLSLCSIVFTGKFTNLHQGFEVLHESSSLPDELDSKTAREYVDRLLLWLDDHRDVPFFVFLHIADPHDPYEPYPPYNTIWGNAADEADHATYVEKVKEEIEDPLRKLFAMPTRDELVAAGIDPEEYVAHDRNYYDGSIRAMDAEIGRLMERLGELGLDDRTVVVFTSDH